MIVGVDDGMTKVAADGSNVRYLDGERKKGPRGRGSHDAEDCAAAVEEVAEGLGDDRGELEASREVYDRMSAEYRKYIAEKVANLPIVRYRRREPFDENEKRIIAAALMARQPLYKVAQTLRCSYAKIDKAIMDDEYLTELALETKRREREEVEEGIDDCVKARVPAVLMWKAAKIMPEKYGEQVNMETEDDTRLVIGAIPDEEVSSAEAEVAEMADKVPVVATPALIEANERAAEMAAAGEGVSYEQLESVPGAPALKPPQGDAHFAPYVPASGLNAVDAEGNAVGGAGSGSIPEREQDMGPDNYGMMNDDVTDFGAESWI